MLPSAPSDFGGSACVYFSGIRGGQNGLETLNFNVLLVLPKLASTTAMAPRKRKATRSPGSRPPALAAPESPRFLPCPICGKSFIARILEQHAWSCTAATAPPNNNGTGGDVKSVEDKFVDYPVCSRSFPQHAIESHARGCVPPTRPQRLADDLEGAAAAGQRSPGGAGEGATPANREQTPGRMTDSSRTSSSLLSRGGSTNVLSTLEVPQDMTVPSSNSQQGDAMKASVSPVLRTEGSQLVAHR